MYRRTDTSISFVFEELEPRIMYSADFAPGLADHAAWQSNAEVRVFANVASDSVRTSDALQADQRRKEIIFVDQAVENYQTLVDDIWHQRRAGVDMEFFLLDGQHDGVEQISATLKERQGIDAVHIISHGGDATLRLGSTFLNDKSLGGYVDTLAQWRGALNANADLLLYGCNLAADERGAAFTNQLARVTGADVAASEDVTGSAIAGGDWLLERSVGHIETSSLVQAPAQTAWIGSLGNEFQVNTTTNNGQDTSALVRGSQQAIAYDAAGNFVVVWTSKSQDTSGTDGVYARRFTDDGTPLTGEILVNTTVADDQNMARVVSDAAGNFVVTWTSNQQDGSSSGVYARRFDANGVALTGEIAVNTITSGDQENSVIAMNRTSSEFVVVWQGEGAGDANGIFFRRFAADGTALDAAERRVNTSDSGAEGNPAVAMDTSGRFVVAFDVNDKMYFQRFDASGATQGGRTQVDNVASTSTGAAIAMDDAGNFTLVYREQNVLTGVWGRGYMSDGTQRYTWFRPATGDATSPSIAMAADGAFVVTYQRTGVAGVDVYALKHNADGSENGSAFIVNQTTATDQTAPSIALLSTDHFTVVWSGQGMADSNGVSARTFSPANTSPVIGLSGAVLNYMDGDGPTLIDAGATVTDAESPNFGTGTLTVSFTANGTANDRLIINNQGSAAGQIGVSGSVITYGGIAIGSFVGGSNGSTPLVVTFNYAATPSAAQALLRNIQYHNVSGTPSTLTRTVQAVLTDGDGATSNVATRTIQVADANQPPSSSGGSVTSVEDTSLVFAWADFNVIDADGAIGATTALRLTTLPAGDGLEYFNGRAWTRAGLGQVFTKADIDAGLLRITPLADESGYDGYAAVGVGNLKQDYAQFSFTPIQATIETIVNPGGEADGLADGVSQTGATGWSQSGNNAGVQNLVPSPDTFPIDHDASLFADAGGLLTQTLAATFSSARNYSLSFEFGWRGDAASYPTEPGFKIELYAGGTLLGEFNETYITGEQGKFVAGVLAVDGSLSGATNGSALQIKLTGTWTQAKFDNLRLISFDRGSDIGAAAQMTVDVTPVNDAPANSLPAPLSVNEDASLAIAGLSIADVDAATASTQLAVSNGTLNVNLAGGAAISAGANNSSSLTLSGTLVQINAALATLSYQGNLNFNGSDSLQVLTNDLGGFGAGGVLSDTDSLAITVNAVNDAPVINSNGGGTSASLAIAENSIAVTTVSASDVDAQPLTYSIIGGADAAKFSINAATGALSFIAAPDYEAPSDGGADNVYDVIVRASDGALSDSQAIAVSVTPLNDSNPVITSNGGGASASVSVAENSTAVTTVTATDADLPAAALTYAIIGGADAARFTVNPTTGALSFAVAPNFEVPTDAGADNVYDVVVQVSDGSSTDSQSIAVSVTPVNENAPVITSNGGGASASMTISENASAVTSVTATDGDLPAAALTYTIVGGADAAKFTLNPTTGALSFVAAPDYEAPSDGGANNIYDVIVQVSDGTLSDSQTIAVSVTAVNDNNPVIASNGGGASASVNVAEGGTAVTNVTATDADLPSPALTYTIIGGADAAKFSINAATGALSFASAQNFEIPTDANADNVYEVTVRASDGVNTDTQSIGVSVTNVNEAPNIANQTFALAENSPNVTLVSNVGASDADAGDTLTYAITAGNIGGAFNIDAAGQIRVANSAALNFEATPAFNLTVLVSDAGGLSSSAVITVNVTNVNEAPVNTVPGSTLSVNEDAVLPIAGISIDDVDGNITNVQASVANGKLSVSLAGGATIVAGANGSASLRLSGTQAQINAALASITYQSSANFNGADVLTLVTGDAGGSTDTDTVNITVNPLNDAPVAGNNAYGANENGTLAIGALGGVLSDDSDAENAALSAALVSGPSSGSLTFNADGSFVYTPNANFNGTDSFSYRASDGSLDSNIAAVTINVSSVNTAPFISNNTGLTLSEGASSVIDATQLRADDFDNSAAQLVYTLASMPTHGVLQRSGLTLTVGGQFTQQDIDANVLSYTHDGGESISDSFVFTVSDGLGGVSGATSFGIAVNTVNDTPVITSNGGGANAVVSLDENTSAVTTVIAVDADVPANVLRFMIAGGADAALFAIDSAGGALRFVAAPDYESPRDVNADNTYEVVVGVDDGVGGLVTQAMSISIGNVNEAPMNLLPSQVSGVEDTPMALTGIGIVDADSNITSVQLSVSSGVLNVDLAGGANVSAGANDTSEMTLTGTQPQLSAAVGSISYRPFLDFNGNDTLLVVSTDADGLTTADALTVNVLARNDAPNIDASALVLSEGESVVLSAANLSAHDVEQAAAQLRYDIASVAGGRFELRDAQGVAVSHFTQADIDNGLVLFVHDGGEQPASYEVSVSDGVASGGPSLATVTFTNVNDLPSLHATLGARLSDAGTLALGASDLLARDADNSASQLVYVIVTGPANGRLELTDNPGVGITSFTQADIDTGRVRYVRLASAGGDSFAFLVSDGSAAPIAATFSIKANAEANQNTDLPVSNSTPPASKVVPEALPEQVAPQGLSRTGTATIAMNPMEFGPRTQQASASFIVAFTPEESGQRTVMRTDYPSSSVRRISQQATVANPRAALAESAQADNLKLGDLDGSAANASKDATSLRDIRYARQLDQARERASAELRMDKVAIGSTIVASTGLSVGYVLWLLRGGVLVSGLLSSLPAWRMIDPLPVLGRTKDEDTENEEESLQSLVKKHWRPREAEALPASAPIKRDVARHIESLN